MNQWGSYLGFGNIPGSTNYATQAVRDYMGQWGNAWQAFLAPYLQQFGGTPFASMLQGNQSEIKGLFDAENARRLAAGGDLLGQLRPDDWLQNLIPGFNLQHQRVNQGFDPLSWYMSQSPQQRGEGRPSNPFTRWLTF